MRHFPRRSRSRRTALALALISSLSSLAPTLALAQDSASPSEAAAECSEPSHCDLTTYRIVKSENRIAEIQEELDETAERLKNTIFSPEDREHLLDLQSEKLLQIDEQYVEILRLAPGYGSASVSAQTQKPVAPELEPHEREHANPWYVSGAKY